MINRNAYLVNFVPQFNTIVKYSLIEDHCALTFQVLEQSPDVTAFLSAQNFMAKNGMTIGISQYPEFKASKNTIFLRGESKDNNFKPDVTTFVGNMQRDNQKAMFIEAIQELVDTVKKAFRATPIANHVNQYGYGYSNGFEPVNAPCYGGGYHYTKVKAHNRRVANVMPGHPMFCIKY